MRFAFKSLPGSPIDIPRPTVSIAADGPLVRLNLLALADTGALVNRFGRWIADEIGIGLGGYALESVTTTLALTVGYFTGGTSLAKTTSRFRSRPDAHLWCLRWLMKLARQRHAIESTYTDFGASRGLLPAPILRAVVKVRTVGPAGSFEALIDTGRPVTAVSRQVIADGGGDPVSLHSVISAPPRRPVL